MYESLGVKPVINATGTVTALGGSLMPTDVVEAMDSAASRFVPLDELQSVIGKKIATLIGCGSSIPGGSGVRQTVAMPTSINAAITM